MESGKMNSLIKEFELMSAIAGDANASVAVMLANRIDEIEDRLDKMHTVLQDIYNHLTRE